MKYLKSYNESIRHLLKPKSEEEILNNFKNLDDYSSLRKAAEYGVLYIIKEIVEKTNLSTDSYHLYVTLSIASIYDQIDIVKYLVDEIGVDPFISISKRDPYTDTVYRCAYDIAISLNHINIIKFLLNDPRIIHHVLPDRINYYKFLHSDKVEESIRHLLKPKSEETILKSLEKEHIEDKYRILLLYQLYDLAEKIGKEIRNYFFIYSSDYDALIRKRTPIRFNDEEVDLIVKQIKVDANSLNYAKFNHVEGGEDPLRMKFTSLYIRDSSYTYEINNYKYFITVKHYNPYKNIKEYYICKSMKELLKYLDDYMIMVKNID